MNLPPIVGLGFVANRLAIEYKTSECEKVVTSPAVAAEPSFKKKRGGRKRLKNVRQVVHNLSPKSTTNQAAKSEDLYQMDASEPISDSSSDISSDLDHKKQKLEECLWNEALVGGRNSARQQEEYPPLPSNTNVSNVTAVKEGSPESSMQDSDLSASSSRLGTKKHDS